MEVSRQHEDEEPGLTSNRADIYKGKRRDFLIEKNIQNREFTMFDRDSIPIAKLEKRKPELLLLEKYLQKIVDEDKELTVADFGSQDGILGIVAARGLGINWTYVGEATPFSNLGHRIITTAEANDVFLPEIETKVGLDQQSRKFDLIVLDHIWGENSNIFMDHLSRDVFPYVEDNGRIVVVSHKKRGAERLVEELNSRGLVSDIVSKGHGGYRLIEILPQEFIDTSSLDLAPKSISFEFGGSVFEAKTLEGTFSNEKLDSGTRDLLEAVRSEVNLNGMNVLDFGTGWGAIEIVLNRLYPEAYLTGLENDSNSLRASEANLGSANNVDILKANITDIEDLFFKDNRETYDYIISNPPFHINNTERKNLVQNMKKTLTKHGTIYLVIENSFLEKFTDEFTTAGMYVGIKSQSPQYSILKITK